MKWQTKDGRLSAELSFKDQTTLAEYLLMVAKLSDEIGHHADMEIRYNKLVLSLYTHDVNAITEKDIELSKKLSELTEALQ